MTLTQLETFVLVARLGSVKAAARSLGVSEPAVSAALAALRQQLGDTLVERTARGMELTPGGRRLVPIASQMVGLAVEAEAAIRQAQGAPETLRVVATSEVAESVAPALVAAFATRSNAVEVSLGVSMTDDMAALLQERLADVAIGPRLASDGFPRLDCNPLFRFRLIFVAAPSHRLAGGDSPFAPRMLAQETWLVGPDAGDQRSPVRALMERLRVPEERIRMFPSHAAALTAAEQRQGIAPAIAHVVLDDPDRKGLVQLPIRGTPLDLLWHVTMLASDRRSTAAAAFHRFVGTPAATHAMHTPVRGVPPSRFKPPVYVTLWA
jgi:LysR family transcriptional regulator, low CO2-responsive transcriptional regulator